MSADHDDAPWRRPPPGSDDEDKADNGYPGPPPTLPPSGDWRVPLVPPTATPRSLPPLDHDAVDTAEERAARLTYAIGAVVAVLLGLALCVHRLL